ncbi:phospholipase D gamma 1-like isoform X2 [Musa acuminata AAA Group]|uniref:phospholipase D gamma 1-like isoform X2 n=1 Tax=Musa acuminata AAA Group TaxID=214697 RepID=UPI0031DBC6B0
MNKDHRVQDQLQFVVPSPPSLLLEEEKTGVSSPSFFWPKKAIKKPEQQSTAWWEKQRKKKSMDNPYPYSPYGYPNHPSPPPPVPNPYQSPYQPPPPYLYPSNSFPSPQDPQPQFNHSGSFHYLPPPSSSYPPPPPPSVAPPIYSYDPYCSPQNNPHPYIYPHSLPYDPNSSGFHHTASSSHHEPSEHAVLSAQSSISSSSSSIYPIDDLLANVRLSDQSSGAPPGSVSSHHRPGVDCYQHQSSSSGGFSPYTPVSAPPPASFGVSQHGAIVPFVGASPSKGRASLKVLLLHGNLDIWVMDAKNLPNMDLFSKTLGDLLGPRITGTITGKVEQMTSITSDPYVTITVSGAAIGRTYVLSNSENPVWMQHFNVPVAHHAAEVQFVVKDSDVVGAQLIGVVSIPAEQIYSGQKVEGAYQILGPNGKQCKPGSVLRLSIQYIPMERLSIYRQGVGAGPHYCGVPDTYFPLRKGGKVTLYQDAHVPDGCLPDLRLGNGMHYEHGKCWHDIFNAISQARRLIYIVGWSVFHTVQLVRGPDGLSSPILGDLLRSKSQEGVRVLLLVWDDPTSRNILGFRTNGVMGTRDEETRRFFKHSSVQVLLCPRSAGKRHGIVKQQETGAIYTHHQKQVIVDADAGNGKRKIIAFVGGLDLCGGRYDTPKHSLFRTLQTLHKDDYYNPNFVNSDDSGPREPWHDLHSKIDGPAAYDVLKNFEERWLKASKHHGIKKLKKSSDDALLIIEKIPDILRVDDLLFMNDNDPETWHVQIFRSIDSNSVKGFPKDPRDATKKNLVCGKNVLIDMSIHRAYVHAIRAAQHFIYIENQYFLGSSFNWDSNKDLGANNLIPIEIALKIANKIRAKERFSAYIVIPMWPEGNPTGAPTQRILFWQNKTMQMMYETIYTALKEVGLENTYEPQDYLNFFCLGNREVPDVNNSSRNAETSSQALAKKNRRFMIYVHSKGMIVDDEYVILGSANINQRSLEGTRDTEIAMGAYQPQHTRARKLSSPRGQIFGYRMSLWAEHIGTIEECFNHPESLECMRRVRDMGQFNWSQYVADEITEIRGHLLKYPVDVNRKGKVKPLPGHETFPDIGGKICGSFFAIQENLTI